MIYSTLKAVHVLSIIVWIGGMVFANLFLRPAVAQPEAPGRLRLMHDVLGRFYQRIAQLCQQTGQPFNVHIL